MHKKKTMTNYDENKIDRFEANWIRREILENSRSNVPSARFNRFPEFSTGTDRRGTNFSFPTVVVLRKRCTAYPNFAYTIRRRLLKNKKPPNAHSSRYCNSLRSGVNFYRRKKSLKIYFICRRSVRKLTRKKTCVGMRANEIRFDLTVNNTSSSVQHDCLEIYRMRRFQSYDRFSKRIV